MLRLECRVSVGWLVFGCRRCVGKGESGSSGRVKEVCEGGCERYEREGDRGV